MLELLSPSDRLATVQAKMQEYMASGVRLGWLIDPGSQQVEVYRQGQASERLVRPASLSGETVLSGFVLNMELVW